MQAAENLRSDMHKRRLRQRVKTNTHPSVEMKPIGVTINQIVLGSRDTFR